MLHTYGPKGGAKEAPMSVKNLSILFLFAIVSTGCSSQTGWKPTVDPYNDPNAGFIHRDQLQCEQMAHSAKGNLAAETGKGALVGGAVGAAGGAAIGAAAGAPALGAAVGAAAGGVGGAVKQGFGAEETYKRAYINCMRNRGHNVLN